MKRFTETQKWADPWFRRLSPAAKLLWQWLLDSCDHAGIVTPDLELAEFQIGANIDAETLSELGERVIELGEGKYFVPRFIEFQYGQVSRDCRAHNPVFTSLEKHAHILQKKGYPYPLDRVQDKDKDIDKDKDKDKTPAKPAEPSADDLLEKFWNAYPQKGRERARSRANVKKAWDKVRASERPSESILMRSLADWKKSEHWAEGYVCGAHLFIRDRMWEDAPKPARVIGAGFATSKPPAPPAESDDFKDGREAVEFIKTLDTVKS